MNWNAKGITLYLVTAVAVISCVLMAWPFLAAITGAVVLAIVTDVPFLWLRQRVKSRTLAASLALVVVAICIIVPAVFLGQGIAHHLLALMRLIQSGTLVSHAQSSADALFTRYPKAGAWAQQQLSTLNLDQVTERAASWAASAVSGLLSGSLSALTETAILLFLLFFLYRDRESALAGLRRLLPLAVSETDYLLNELKDTVLATVLGRFVVAGVQGATAGISYWLLGVPDAGFLGAVTAIFAMFPALGAFFVWLPVAVYLAMMHLWVKAVIMCVVGGLIIGSLDNLLYPMLVGTRMKSHTAAIFLAVMGGVVVFGLVGLLLGPILLTSAAALLHIWRERSAGDIPQQRPNL